MATALIIPAKSVRFPKAATKPWEPNNEEVASCANVASVPSDAAEPA